MTSVNELGESYLFQLERLKEEIRAKFAVAHQVLVDREAELMLELDQYLSKYLGPGPGEGVKNQFQELTKAKEQLMTALKANENQKTLQVTIDKLDARIRELEITCVKAKDGMKNLVLDWDMDLERRLSDMGGLHEVGFLGYSNKEEPVLIAGKHGYQTSTPAVFHQPTSIAIDQDTGNVFICDRGNNRVQVFSKAFQFLYQFKASMDVPVGICVDLNKIFVTQLHSNSLSVYTDKGTLLQKVGSLGKRALEFDSPFGIAISPMRKDIYICENFNNRIQCLSFDFQFIAFILNIDSPRDIKLTKKEILILKRGKCCMIVFNYSHQFVREMIPCGEGIGNHLIRPFYFCVDQMGNILITDLQADCVAIFSSRGNIIQKIGRRGKGRGQFVEASGIALDSDHRIIVVSQNPDHCIQLF